MRAIHSLSELSLAAILHPLEQDGIVTERALMEVNDAQPPLRDPHRLISNISHPELLEFQPQQDNGHAILIIPGGGYQFVSIDNEGIEVAKGLSSMGYHAFCLNYRLPNNNDGSDLEELTPIVDARAALSVVRQLAPKAKVGVMGFSAGGHLAGWLSTDKRSSRPDFTCLMYPVVSMTSDFTHLGTYENVVNALHDAQQVSLLSIDKRISSDVAPMFIMHAKDDEVVVAEHSIKLHHALLAASVPSELTLFERGGHGFGAYVREGSDAKGWLQRFDDWVHNLDMDQ
ncbi:Acetylxylan esterase precursor [Vibrio thalassae]|uniref:Acetylxylan esterase n=1 Tax=Vibrio thalassae TaxID=1243014 RepID=A0A240ELX1_9VIBR|nr:alpha/beta hydrolase [Vibrio thalassae]SNX49616.1 Acetylxylan esterase precursor [Vibrio thalassae]